MPITSCANFISSPMMARPMIWPIWLAGSGARNRRWKKSRGAAAAAAPPAPSLGLTSTESSNTAIGQAVSSPTHVPSPIITSRAMMSLRSGLKYDSARK